MSSTTPSRSNNNGSVASTSRFVLEKTNQRQDAKVKLQKRQRVTNVMRNVYTNVDYSNVK
jgi:hypothetical protein